MMNLFKRRRRGRYVKSRKSWRHSKPNRHLTANLYATGVFKDKRSFVDTQDHEYLYGMDKEERRIEIFERAKGYCQLRISAGCAVRITLETGEWDHIVSGHYGRCDCLGDGLIHGGRAVCTACHKIRHNRDPKWTRKGVV